MKFGITPLNFDTFDQDIELRNLKFPLLVEKAINAGYKHVEVTMDLEYVLPGSISKRVIKQLLEIKENSGISYSIHLPLWSIELAGPNSRIREASCQCIIESIKRTAPLEPEAYVLHVTGALVAEFSRLDLPRDMKATLANMVNLFASESIEKILNNVDIESRKIAVENVEFPFEFSRKLVDKYDFSICFDTGHLLAGYSGELSVHEFLDKHMDRIIEFHLNDAKFVKGRPNDHIAIGDGNFPMDAIGKIKKHGFKGPLVFELTFADAEKSLKRIKKAYSDLL